jgi:hypothetical protein
MFTLQRIVVICVCTHSKREHWCTKPKPQGRCLVCSCEAFTPEPICKCGHGKKAHSKGRCHEGDGCKKFRPRSS